MTSSPVTAPATGILLAVAILLSCASPGGFQAAQAAISPAPGPTAGPLGLGTFEAIAGRAGLVVAAPHEGWDIRTTPVASAAAEILGAGFVSADGFRNDDHPINVNRPTEGVGLEPEQETPTERAGVIFLAYLARLGEAARGPVQLLIEIHGNSRPANVGVIDVATVGVSPERATDLARELESRFATVSIRVEPAHEVHYKATGSKRSGSLKNARMALHFELPFALRSQALARDTGRRVGEAIKAWLPAELSHLWSGRVYVTALLWSSSNLREMSSLSVGVLALLKS